MTLPELSIIIVSWNVSALLVKAIDSVKSSWHETAAMEIIVVDNASTDDSVLAIRANHPDVILIENDRNLGFTGGNNVGLRASTGKKILLLNPDTEVQDGALSTLVNFMDKHEDVGMVGPQLLYADGTVQSSKRRFPTRLTLFLDSTWAAQLAPNALLDQYYANDLPDDQVHDVEWLYGAAMLIRRELYESVGGFDEAFFMYSEELDWCKRIHAAGWRVVYYPHAKVVHYEGKSSEQVVAARHINFFTSRVRYTEKYFGRSSASLLRIWLLCQFVIQLCLESFKWLIGHKRELRSERIRAYRQVLLSGLKP